MIIYGQYILYTDNEKESNIKSFLKKISDELFEQELYQKFGYNVNRKMNKSNLQEVLLLNMMKDYFHFYNNILLIILGLIFLYYVWQIIILIL